MAFEKERELMVETQIKARNIKDKKVLEAMLKVPRHEFIPKQLLDEAYADYPLSIGNRQTISQPYIVALMTELLELNKDKIVLEIGTGSGYQAAIVSKIAKKVTSRERIDKLSSRSRNILKKYKNISKKGEISFGKASELAGLREDELSVKAYANGKPQNVVS